MGLGREGLRLYCLLYLSSHLKGHFFEQMQKLEPIGGKDSLIIAPHDTSCESSIHLKWTHFGISSTNSKCRTTLQQHNKRYNRKVLLRSSDFRISTIA